MYEFGLWIRYVELCGSIKGWKVESGHSKLIIKLGQLKAIMKLGRLEVMV